MLKWKLPSILNYSWLCISPCVECCSFDFVKAVRISLILINGFKKS